MKTQIAVALAGALVMILGGALSASAQQFRGFYCQMELGEAVREVPEGVEELQTTTDSKKVCSGGSPPNNILLECRDLVVNWTGGNFRENGVRCQVYARPCGIDEEQDEDGFLDEPFTSSLQINAAGRALLRCQFKPS